MDIPVYCLVQNLRTAKCLSDSGYIEQFLKECGQYQVDDEMGYEISWAGITSVFPKLCNYYNEEIEAEIIVFFDPLIDEFCRLCRLYEEREGLPLGTSPLRELAVQNIYASFELYDYNYDYDFRFYHNGHGRDRMVMLMGCEFSGFEELPVTMADVRNTLEAQVCKLREELVPKVLPRKNTKKKKLKEAA